MRALRLLPLVLALAACDTLRVLPPEGAVRADGFSLTADRPSYDNRDEVTLTLRNDGPERGEMGVLACAALEQRTDDGWTQDLAHNDRACIMLLVYVEPGSEQAAVVELEGVPDGTYRFTHRVSGVEVATASFEVR